jgi:hypothetical protein
MPPEPAPAEPIGRLAAAMPAPLPLPMRVLVKGSSIVNWSSSRGGPRSEFTFPRAIEATLHAAGRPAEVRAPSVAGELTRHGLHSWEHEALTWSPDAVVLAFGYYESIHFILPWWLERHVHALNGRSGPVRKFYRQRLLEPLWMVLARLQAKADSTFNPLLFGRHRRVVADLELLVGHLQDVASPLIVFVELLPPSARYASWFPGMAARIARMNQALEELVARLDQPNVRMLHTTEVVDEVAGGDLQVAVPDGFHFSPSLHRAIGEALGAQLVTWAETQDHLKLPE